MVYRILLYHKAFEKEVPSFFDCGFYVYAMQNPFLIPYTSKFIVTILRGANINGSELLLLKLVQLFFVVMIAYFTKKIFKYVFSQKVYEGFSGGRGC